MMADIENKIVTRLDAHVAAYEQNLRAAASTAKTQGDKMSGAMNKARDAAKSVGTTFKGMRGAVTQMGFQFQDVAVQAQMGTNALVILGQQGSQIASIFGPGGAVVGALLAIGSALAFALIPELEDSAEEAETLTNALKKLKEETQLTDNQLKFLQIQAKKEREEKETKIKVIEKEIEATQKLVRGFIQARAEQIKSGKTTGEARVELEIFTSQINRLNEELVTLKTKLDIATGAAKGLGDGDRALKDQVESAKKFVEQVNARANAIGKTASQLLIEKAATMQLNAEQKAAVDASIAVMQAEEELAANRKRLAQERKEQNIIDKETEEELKRLEKLEEFAMTRAELLDEQYTTDLERLAEAGEALNLTEEELLARRLEIVQAYAEKKYALLTRESKRERKLRLEDEKDVRLREQAKLNASEKTIQAGMVIANAFFEDNKAIKAGLIIADTASAIMKSLSMNPYDYANVALLAATGAANLATALGAQKGGGATPSSPSGGPPANTEQDSFVPETTDLEVTSTIEGEGTQTRTVSLDIDTMEELGATIAKAMRAQ